jgi:flagellar hook-associated protein 2
LDITVAKDTSVISSRIETFVKAYNAINQLLSDTTKFDPSTKSGALLQGDASALTLQNNLRSAVQSVSKASSVFQRLSDIGVSQLRGGDLAIDTTKLASSVSNPDEMKKMFTSTGGGSADGIAVKVKALATSLLSSEGFFKTKTDNFNIAVKRNTRDQELVNERAAQVEASLNKQYADLDAKMSNLNALNAYITQQVASWNKQT